MNTQTRKRLFSFTVALVMISALVSLITVNAADDFEISNGVLTKYNGTGGNVTIPNGVTQINNYAFANCTSLTSITIPSSVIEIGYCAFSDCTNLTNIVIQNGVSEIGSNAFYNCSLTSITIPGSVNKIGYESFLNCTKLTNVTIQSGVNEIGGGAFSYCRNLTRVSIPNSITVIESWAFAYCESLTSITIPNSVRKIEFNTFEGCENLKSIEIPNSVTDIGSQAFLNCVGLTSITIPSSVTNIEEQAFYVCTSLTSINVDTNNKNYSTIDGVLYNKDKTIIICYPAGKPNNSFTIPESVTEIGYYAFYACDNLINITIPNSVTKIGWVSFYGCQNLTTIIMPSSVTEIGKAAFRFCPKLTIYGTIGSYAETFAKNDDIKFVAGTPTPMLSATPTSSTVFVNGENISFDAYNINGNNYFKLRDLAYVLNGTEKQFEVGYDNSTKAITLTSGKSYTPVGGEMSQGDGKEKTAVPTASKIYLEGKELSLTVYNIGGNNFFKLRDLLKAIDVYVGYDNATKTITLDTSRGYVDD